MVMLANVWNLNSNFFQASDWVPRTTVSRLSYLSELKLARKSIRVPRGRSITLDCYVACFLAPRTDICLAGPKIHHCVSSTGGSIPISLRGLTDVAV